MLDDRRLPDSKLDLLLPLPAVPSAQLGCAEHQVVSTVENHPVRDILQRYLEHKEETLRQRLRAKAACSEKLAQEAKQREEEELENFVFRLADESFPASEVDADEVELPPTYKKFDYPVNESELVELTRQMDEKSLPTTLTGASGVGGSEIGIPCGQKVGNRVILRSFHDRISDEPRGESNYHQANRGREATCLTHSQWLSSLANDPEMLVSLAMPIPLVEPQRN